MISIWNMWVTGFVAIAPSEINTAITLLAFPKATKWGEVSGGYSTSWLKDGGYHRYRLKMCTLDCLWFLYLCPIHSIPTGVGYEYCESILVKITNLWTSICLFVCLLNVFSAHFAKRLLWAAYNSKGGTQGAQKRGGFIFDILYSPLKCT